MFFGEQRLTEKQARLMNPVVLAFVGDAVYTLFVRTTAATQSDGKANALNKKSASEVSAVSQAKKIDALLTILTEEELGVFKRARNAKKTTRAKHASVSQYNKSTGFEALVGYLYLTGQEERLKQVVSFEVQEEEEYEG